MAIRSAEASRNATCSFADRVAEHSIAFYRSVSPRELQDSFNQTVVATIIVQKNIDSDVSVDRKTELKVVSMGVGTKVVAAEIIVSHKIENRSRGDRLVRDSHAEVLARRGFMRYLYGQIRQRLDKSGSVDESHCIFSPPTAGSGGKLVLKPGVQFHLYTSSQPCGNASIKRWAKVKQLRYRAELSADSFPLDPHERIQVTPESRREGQVALLVKRNGGSNAEQNSDISPGAETQPLSNLIVTNSFIPVGTALPSSLQGNVMTCSDKIAMWNAVGLQGALLTTFIEPIYLSTITVGRKFSQVHCQRALCCRLQDFQYPVCTVVGKRNDNKKRKQGSPMAPNSIDADTTVSSVVPNVMPQPAHAPADTVSPCERIPLIQPVQKGVFSIHHPAMLGTQVKLDEGSIVTGPVVGSSTTGNGTVEINSEGSIIGKGVSSGISEPIIGARFLEPRCIVSYSICKLPDKGSAVSAPVPGYVLEVLDGRTGLLVNPERCDVENTDESSVSSSSLRAAFEELCSVVYAESKPTGSMDTYCALKRRVAPDYAAAKDTLLSDPLTFAEWARKDT